MTTANKKIAITTDSNSGILPKEGGKLGAYVLPMPCLINGNCLFENVDITQQEFYDLLAADAEVSTSQPSVSEVTEFWTDILKDYDEIVHVPMSSGLSKSCETAQMLAKEFGGRVYVVDNRRISVTLKSSVLDAINLREQGKSAEEIKTALEASADDSSIYIAVDTMKYLKKGGRVTPAAAAIGGILKIKPVLQIQGERLDKYALARGTLKAKELLKNAVRNALDTRFASLASEGAVALGVGHTANEAEAKKFVEELKKDFPTLPVLFCEPLPLSVSCHIGPGALALTITRVLK